MFRPLPLVVAALALAACAGEPAAETAGTTPPAPAATSPAATPPGVTTPTAPAATAPAVTSPEATTPAVVVPEALRFTAPLVGGGELDLASLAGQRVLLWFWAPG